MMNIENRVTKLYIKELSPAVAIELIEKYKIPTPYKEILIAVCVEHRYIYPAMRHLSKEYGINLEYKTVCRRLKVALEMFRKANALDKNSYL